MGKSKEMSQICLGWDSNGDSLRKSQNSGFFWRRDKNDGVALFWKRVFQGV
jgi:hypothetical protein